MVYYTGKPIGKGIKQKTRLQVESVRALSRYFGMEFLWLEIRKKMDNGYVRPLSNYFNIFHI